jgi:tRNA A-37 threonylcarbamoyl transferase component Bud32
MFRALIALRTLCSCRYHGAADSAVTQGSILSAETTSGVVETRIGGRFIALDVLGRGGMAEVYRVRDEASGRELALKRLRKERARSDGQALALFQREYQTLAQLSHPCIIQVFDYGVDDDGAFYTMELLDGVDLKTRGRLPSTEACAVLYDLASVLAVLHARHWLYRDLSPRNVVCLRNGQIKLIDFGAMTPMGAARNLVGTPPFVPPEALQQQTLDARADLYSLGALGYWLLTGRHAYPAQSFDELRDRMRSQPRPPHRWIADIPPALSSLIMELLSPDWSARPASAAVAMERLGGILGRSSEEHASVSHAYLARPKLVGREELLAVVRKRIMLESLRGKGSSILVEGAPGTGRSRFLDACVLEAKLLGATVLRAATSEAARGDYGVAIALAEQLLSQFPELASQAAGLRRPLLATVVPGLAEAETREPSPALHGSGEQSAAGGQTRRHLQTAFRDWFRSVARYKRIVIAVDDIERIDEPSAALLGALAHRSERRKLVVVATARSDVMTTPGLEVLRSVALRLSLAPLSREETEALLGSLFGNARHVAAVAQRVHELSEGNPRQVMELAEHLVRRGVARYAAGSWVLPQQLARDDLPASIEAALFDRIAELEAGPRELAECLALTDPLAISLPHYGTLLPSGHERRAFEYLDTLVTAGILTLEGERYRFSHESWKERLAEQLEPERKRALHARLAQTLAGLPDTARWAHHLMESGQGVRALQVLLTVDPDKSLPFTEANVRLLESAVAFAEADDLPVRQCAQLRSQLLNMSGLLGKLDVFTRHAEIAIAALEAASGLADYRALPDSMPAEQRLTQALQLAQQRYDNLPEAQRDYAPIDAIRELATLCGTMAALAVSTADRRVLQQIPSLTPLSPLSPAIGIMEQIAQSVYERNSGRDWAMRAAYLKILERVDMPDRAGLAEAAHRNVRLGAILTLGMIDARWGLDSALTRVAELEEQPGYRVNAWRIHSSYHLMQGNLEEAQRCARRAELLHLQDGSGQIYPNLGLHSELFAYWLSDDLEGLKQMEERARNTAARFPAMIAYDQIVRCHYLRLRGDLQSALEISAPLVEALTRDSPLVSIRVMFAVGTHLTLLHAVGRDGEAVELGGRFMRAAREQGFQLDESVRIVLPLCEAMAAAGQAEEAVTLCEALIAEHERAGARGLVPGASYETRARIALAQRNQADFETWAERCSGEYRRGNSPPLRAKLGRLLQQAERLGLRHAQEPIEVHPASTPAESSEIRIATLVSRIDECLDARERAHCVLATLLEHTGAIAGHLYAPFQGQLAHRVSIPDAPPEDEIRILLEEQLRSALGSPDAEFTTCEDGQPPDPPMSFEPDTTLPGTVHRARPLILSALREGEPVVAALAALEPGLMPLRPPSAQLLATLAASLIEHDDVDPVTQFR